MNINNLFVFSGRVCGWDEDETWFVKADSYEEAEQAFKDHLVCQEGGAADEIYINFAASVAEYQQFLLDAGGAS